MTVAAGAARDDLSRADRWRKPLAVAFLLAAAVIVVLGLLHTNGTRAEAMFTDAANGSDWPGYGRLYDEQHYSPLTQINTATVSRLGLSWWADLPPVSNPATAPLAVDGVVYISYGLSVVHAYDADTGKLLWNYHPRVADVAGDKLKFAWGIRGMAWWDGLVLTGTQDGRLIALDAKTGALRWSVQTTQPGDSRYITGAPRVFAGKVIIGHGGGDFGPTRGYVTAYDVKSGKQLWRFHTVPGNPADGFENKAMEMAAKTWTGAWWKYGGGGTVWNAITYDPRFNRIYLGTGNGQPWNRKVRSPDGGDNLFLCSVVALDADTGAYVWHYQTNPGETWDYNSAMDMTLADLNVAGERRSVILHAPKNGFLYVIDRKDGKLVSAEKIVPHVTWASHINLDSGRPVENPDARYPNGKAQLWPSPGGAHNWPAQSFSPQTGLLYIPTIDLGADYDDSMIDKVNWRGGPAGELHTAVNLTGLHEEGSEGARLKAWDPVRQREVWSVRLPGFSNAGTMATAGGLVFQGRADGQFVAYDARSGKPLWHYFAGAGISAQPITFARDGVQYVTVIAGYGGVPGGGSVGSDRFGWTMRGQQRRLMTFRLDGDRRLPPSAPEKVELLREPAPPVNPALAAQGAALYRGRCILCHGPGARAGGAAPDLRASPIAIDAASFASVVRGGGLEAAGMPKFAEFTSADTEALRHYIRTEAQQ